MLTIISNPNTLPDGDGHCIRIWVPKPGDGDVEYKAFLATLNRGMRLIILTNRLSPCTPAWNMLFDAIYWHTPYHLPVVVWTDNRNMIGLSFPWQACGCNPLGRISCNCH